MNNGWIGVDFDGTLATYTGWVAPDHCGEPIAPMVSRVIDWLAAGHEVRIFTARAFPFVFCIRPDEQLPLWLMEADRQRDAVKAVEAIRLWCEKHIGRVLPITCVKDYGMIELWDDRAVQVRANTGQPVGESTRGLV